MAACRRSPAPPAAIGIEHEIAPWPARVGAETMTLTISEPGGKPIHGARVSLEGDMSHPGMRPEFGEAKEIELGRYQGRLDLTMAGDWVILMHIKLPDGQTVERQLDVKGVRAN